MTPFDRVRLESLDDCGRFRVWLNENELKCVQSVELHMAAGEFPLATLTVAVDGVDIDEKFAVHLKANVVDEHGFTIVTPEKWRVYGEE